MLSPEEAAVFLQDHKSKPVIYPYLTGDDMLSHPQSLPSRYAIDLNKCADRSLAMKYSQAFAHVKKYVMPTIQANAEDEKKKTGKEIGPRQTHFRRWWKYWRYRPEMIEKIESLPRYIVCSRVTKRPVFEFISSDIRPSDALQVFALADDYSFGILQSGIHSLWFTEKCSSLKGDSRYTSESVFDTFPWPQNARISEIRNVASVSIELRKVRQNIMTKNNWSLRKLYQTLDQPGDTPLHKAHTNLDIAVRSAYEMKPDEEPLRFLFKLNLEVANREASGELIVPPGLPSFVTNYQDFITDDCVIMLEHK